MNVKLIATSIGAGAIAAALFSPSTARAEEIVPVPITPVASPYEDSAALGAFSNYLGVATAVGGFGGTVAGALAGCAIGGIATSPTVVFVPLGCITGAAIGAPIGGVLGTILIGGPTLAIAGADAIATVTAAPGTTRWAK